MFMNKLITLLLCALSSLSFAADIRYEWTDNTLRTDGEAITGEKVYLLRYSIDDVEQSTIEIAGDQTSFTLVDVVPGVYVAQMATSEDGERGEWSSTVALSVPEEDTAKPEKMTITVTFIVDGSNIEAK